ncbi:hypothetical protein KFE25_014279 [Diacronema lutheri]|uniref:Neurotransmitter-gated ion-channel ligand-binding domain-containing protein n=1 Tax=Diacronema lutheri TaxID=2081491 RepID=A0A8J6C4E0_DIALT|nr:hypothetical protein KFE25_014279 [Diacronema lutheri]
MMPSTATMSVRVRAEVRKLLSIELSHNRVRALVFVEASWPDRRHGLVERQLIVTMSSAAQESIPARGEPGGEELFAPRLKFTNVFDKGAEECWAVIYPPRTPGDDPVVCMRWAVDATFAHAFDLHSFPFDAQTVPLTLTSSWPAPAQWLDGESGDTPFYVELLPNVKGSYRSFLNLSGNFCAGEYDVSPWLHLAPALTSKFESASLQRYPLLRIELHVRRLTGFWVSNVISILGALAASALIPLLMPPDELGDRCANLLAIMFAILAYKLILAEQLPKVAYLTMIDRYLLLCFALVMLVCLIAALEFAILGEAADGTSPHGARRDDGRGSGAALPAWAREHTRAPVCLLLLAAWALAHVVALGRLGALRALLVDGDKVAGAHEREREAAAAAASGVGPHDWSAPDDMLWIGPIRADSSGWEHEDRLRALLARATEQLARGGAQPPVVRLFDPDELRVRDAPLDSPARLGAVEFDEVCARYALEKGETSYMGGKGGSRFAIARFGDGGGARAALKVRLALEAALDQLSQAGRHAAVYEAGAGGGADGTDWGGAAAAGEPMHGVHGGAHGADVPGRTDRVKDLLVAREVALALLELSGGEPHAIRARGHEMRVERLAFGMRRVFLPRLGAPARAAGRLARAVRHVTRLLRARPNLGAVAPATSPPTKHGVPTAPHGARRAHSPALRACDGGRRLGHGASDLAQLRNGAPAYGGTSFSRVARAAPVRSVTLL